MPQEARREIWGLFILEKTMKASDLGKDYQESRTNMIQTHETWRVLLDIAYAKLSTEKGFKSRVREGSLSSLILEIGRAHV